MLRHITTSPTLSINTLSKQLLAQNRKIIKFGFGQSPFAPPQNVVNSLKQAAHHAAYSSVQGDLILRERIAQFHYDHNRLKVSADNILVASGSKILLYTILLAFAQADVFLPAPSWVTYAPQAKLAGHHLISLPTSFEQRWRITPQHLVEAHRKKKYQASILILNYPGNPDGLTYSESELKQLAEQARALDILVVSDEIYGLLNHNNNHLSFANYYPEKTITTTGLSKWCAVGGWRFGAALLSEGISSKFKQTLIGVGSETYSCAPMPIQIAAREAYRSFSDTKNYVLKQTNILQQIGQFCTQTLRKFDVKIYDATGAFYLFPDFSSHKTKLQQAHIYSSSELCQRLLNDTGVALLPATAFGFPPNYYAARLAYVDFDNPLQKKNFDLQRDCPKVVEGINLIGSWINAL